MTTARSRNSTILLGVIMALPSCRAPLDNIQVILNRHERAVSQLPEDDRSRLMPYGPAVLTEEAADLLPDNLLLLEAAREIAVRANPDIHAAQARLQAARSRWKEARAQYAPIRGTSQVTAHRLNSTPARRL